MTAKFRLIIQFRADDVKSFALKKNLLLLWRLIIYPCVILLIYNLTYQCFYVAD
jgi:hypothetical protein